MGFLVKGQILANDLVRRLLNTSESLPHEERRLVIDDYARKQRRSGHTKKRTAEIVLAELCSSIEQLIIWNKTQHMLQKLR